MTDLRCWFHKFFKLLKVVPECGSGYRRKTRAWFEIRPLGCRESAGSNLARSNETLCRRVDQIHLYLCTAIRVPVQQRIAISVVNASRADRSDPIFILWLFERNSGMQAIDQF